MRKKFILIAGNPRSGTTFVGKMLALNKSVQYLDEPFNAEYGMTGVKSYFPYISTKKHDEISLHNKKLVDDFLSGESNFRKLDPKDASYKKQYIGRKIFGSKYSFDYKNYLYNPIIKTGIIKDPTASLVSHYMASEHNIPVLVILRHPLATIASFKRLDMIHDILHLHLQPQLADDYLIKFTKKSEAKMLTNIEHNAYHWLIINSILMDFAKQNSNFHIVTHEQLSKDPVKEFRKLYDKYNLKYTHKIQATIKEFTNANNPASAPQNKMHHLRRNSKMATKEWQNILTQKEINTIRLITKPLADNYYSNSTWTS